MQDCKPREPQSEAFSSKLIDFLSLFLLAYPDAVGGLGPQPETSFTLNRLVKKVGKHCENESAAVNVSPSLSMHR